MRLAGRVGRISESVTLRLIREARRLTAEGRDLVDLGAGEPDFDSPAAVQRAGTEAIASGQTRYTDVAGIAALREAIAARYRQRDGVRASAEEVVVAAGAKQALYETALALFEEGDEVLIPSPYWVSFPDQVLLAGAKPRFVATRFADRFKLRAADVEAAWGKRTRAIVVNSPCNPTGAVIEEQELGHIVELAAAAGGVVVFDETYEQFLYDGARHVSAARWRERFPDSVVCCGSASKTFAMTGWRIGWALAPKAIAAAIAKVQGHVSSNAATPSQFAALAALALVDEPESMRREYEKRRTVLLPALAAIPGFEPVAPEGAFYAWVRVERCLAECGLASSGELAERLLSNADVVVVPGEAFGAAGYLRLSFAVATDRLLEGVARIERAVRALVPSRAALPG